MDESSNSCTTLWNIACSQCGMVNNIVDQCPNIIVNNFVDNNYTGCRGMYQANRIHASIGIYAELVARFGQLMPFLPGGVGKLCRCTSMCLTVGHSSLLGRWSSDLRATRWRTGPALVQQSLFDGRDNRRHDCHDRQCREDLHNAGQVE